MNQEPSFKDYIIHNPGYSKLSEPIIKSASGSFLVDINGEKYFDPSLGAGSQILGHSNTQVISTIQKKIMDGSIYLKNNISLHAFCQRLKEVLPNSQRNYVFCNSGSEATQRALRLARAATGRDQIGYFSGGWHGINEWTMAEEGARFNLNSSSIHDGIPKFLKENSLLLPYNEEETFELIKKNSEQLACIIIEPVQGSNPRNDIVPFLKQLQTICKSNGILLIFDEIITGFRLGIGGATELWTLKPDIVTYGKIIGGGLPVGLVTCTDKVAFNSFNNPDKKIHTGGTFSGNPLVSETGTAVISELVKLDYSLINDFGELLRNRLNLFFKESSLPFSTIGTGSINRLAFTDKNGCATSYNSTASAPFRSIS